MDIGWSGFVDLEINSATTMRIDNALGSQQSGNLLILLYSGAERKGRPIEVFRRVKED